MVDLKISDIYTPSLIEDAIRNILITRLAPDHCVAKQGIAIGGSTMRLNPDLVFNEGSATGDVKYKTYRHDVARNDLYQAVTFATAFRATQAAVVAFGVRSPRPGLRIGNVEVTRFDWDAKAPPREAASRLVEDVREWLGG